MTIREGSTERRWKFAIDAGHGPNTPGKRSPDGALREFQFNRAVALYLRDFLSDYDGVESRFTHAEDGSRDVSLKDRTDAANAWGADAFISIHANAYGDGSWNNVKGIETYVYTSRPKDALQLASAVHHSLVQQTGRPDRGIKAANFHVLRETSMAAVLVECEFMTCQESAALLQQDSYRRLCAKAIADGLVDRYDLQVRDVQQSQQSSRSQAPISALYKVQVGAFQYKANAERLVQRLREQGYAAYLKEEST